MPSKDRIAETWKSVVKKPLDGGAKFKVVRINDDGSWHHLTLRTSDLVSTASFHYSVSSHSDCNQRIICYY